MALRLRPGARQPRTASRLTLNPIACDGVGMCAHLAPELITLDRWGFPILGNVPLNGAAQKAAARAVAGCPRRALLLTPESHSEGIQRKPVDNPRG